MPNIKDKIRRLGWTLRWLPWSIRFNLRYLPLRQALRLPVLLCRPRLGAMKGRVEIQRPISTGMIVLGSRAVSIYPPEGIIWDNNGGTVAFAGPCTIGSGSAISVGRGAHLRIGQRVMANARAKIVCYDSIDIADDCRISWETMIMDTDFHTLTLGDGSHTSGHAPIALGPSCWIGTGVLVLKGTRLPAFTTVQARSVLSRDFIKAGLEPRCVIGPGLSIEVKAKNAWRNLADDKVEYGASDKVSG